MKPNVLHAGGEIFEEGESPWGTVGLLANDADGTVFALTTLPVLPSNRRSVVSVGGRLVRLPSARRSSIETSGSQESIIAVAILPSIAVAANVAGLGQAGLPVYVCDALEEPVLVHHQTGVSHARITGFGQNTRLKGFAETVRLEGLFELTLQTGAVALRPGDAGALVMTRGGGPAGLVVAARGESLLAAPLAPFLRARGLDPLDAFSAASHNARIAPPSKSQPIPAAETAARRMGPSARSQELLARAKLPKMLEELELL